MDERIYDVFWEGPFLWNQRRDLTDPRHVLYGIYGTHPVYGREVLLYFGMTEHTVLERLLEHEYWISMSLTIPS
jgi:hypothetical protein